jgi:peptide/nickel transport system permease protein
MSDKNKDAPAPTTDAVNANSGEVLPGASHEGQLVASPAMGTTSESGSVSREHRTERQAEGQLLTGRAARELKPENLPKSLSPAQLTWRQLRKNRLAVIGGIVLILLYSIALFAPFLAPYDPLSQNPGEVTASFHPPMKLRWKDTRGNFHIRPFVYQTQSKFTEDRDLIYLPDAEKITPVRFFVEGSSYKLFGLIPSKTHFLGTEDGALYLLGTDEFGRDYLSRLLYGSQISLSVGLVAIAITFSLGMLVGGISGFYGGRVDNIIMRLCEILMSVPGFYLLLALAAALPADMDPVKVYILIIVILSFVGWAGMARIVRGMVLSVREREYVEAARSLGARDLTIIIRHILPSTFTYAIVAATMSVPGYILGEAGLSFLGLGIRDPMASWGNMLSAAQNLTTMRERHWILAPAAMIFITTMAFNFLGDGLRDALDPKSRGER